LIPEGKSLSASSGSLSPDFKKQLARAIKQGKKLAVGVSSVAGEAQRHIREAWVLYRDLSGECHV
jgi:hypothetical protein